MIIEFDKISVNHFEKTTFFEAIFLFLKNLLLGSSSNIFFSAWQNVLYTHRYPDICYFLVEVKFLIKRKHQQAVLGLYFFRIASQRSWTNLAMVVTANLKEKKAFLIWTSKRSTPCTTVKAIPKPQAYLLAQLKSPSPILR